MKKILITGSFLFLVGCQSEQTTGLTQEDIDLAVAEALEAVEEAKSEAYDEGYETATEEVYDEAYEEGYTEGEIAGYDAAIEEMDSIEPNLTSTPNTPTLQGLSLDSDGFAWNTSTDYSKKEFIQSVYGRYMTLDELNQAVGMIDRYYSQNLILTTLEDALSDLGN